MEGQETTIATEQVNDGSQSSPQTQPLVTPEMGAPATVTEGTPVTTEVVADGNAADKEPIALEAAPATPSAVDTANAEAAETQRKATEEFLSMTQNSPLLKEFETNPVLKMGNAENSFNYQADAAQLNLRKTFDVQDNPFYAGFWKTDESGKRSYDMNKWAKVNAYAANMEGIENALINHGKSLASKQEFQSRHNADNQGIQSAPPSDKPVYTVRRS